MDELSDNQIQETPKNNNDDIPIEEKEKEVNKKKKQFKILILVGKIIALIIVLAFVALKISGYLAKLQPPTYQASPSHQQNEEKPSENEPEPQQTTNQENGNKLFDNQDLMLSLEYPSEAELKEFEEDKIIKKAEISFSQQEEGKKEEGYLFRISTFTTENRTLNDIVRVKRESFIAACPESAQITSSSAIMVDNVNSIVFDVINCESDYKIIYVPKHYRYYEFVQITNGDIGYKQKYKLITKEIMNSVRFYPEEIDIPYEEYKTYRNNKYKFSFIHPQLSDECCEIKGPREKSARLINLYAPENYIDDNSYDGLSIFVDLYATDLSYDGYLTTQRKIFIDDFRVVKGYDPTTSEEKIKVGNLEGLLFKGYSWHNTNYIFVDLSPIKLTNNILIIAIKNTTGNNFDEIVQNILDSFEFWE